MTPLETLTQMQRERWYEKARRLQGNYAQRRLEWFLSRVRAFHDKPSPGRPK